MIITDELEKLGEAEVLKGMANGLHGQPGSQVRSQVEAWLRLKELERSKLKPALALKATGEKLSAPAWSKIENDYGVSKRMFGIKINFGGSCKTPKSCHSGRLLAGIQSLNT